MATVSTTDNINNLTIAGKAAAQSSSAKATNSLVSTTEDFLKLLTVQLQNQDPTKPMETDQITQQIASLSQVEQQINTNTNLEKLMAAYTQSQASSNVSYIGRMVEVPGNQTVMLNGNAVVVYNLETDADSVQVVVSDAQKNVVYTGSGTKIAGRNQLIWDGTQDGGGRAPDGTYTFAVNALMGDGKTVVKSTTSTAGLVTSLETKDGVSNLALGNILVAPDSVTSVRDMPGIA
jgi:flagellar basal-body rod modification protein FlgD